MVTASIEAYYKVETNYPPRATRFFLFPSFPFLFSTPAFPPFPSFFLHSLRSPRSPSPSRSVFASLCPLFSLLSIFSLSLSISLPLFPSGSVFFNFPVFQFPRLRRPNLLYAPTLSSYSTSVRYVFSCFLSYDFSLFAKKQEECVCRSYSRGIARSLLSGRMKNIEHALNKRCIRRFGSYNGRLRNKSRAFAQQNCYRNC